MTTTIETTQSPAQVGAGLSYGAGRILIAPALAAALDAPDVRSAVKGIAWTTGIALGSCIALGIVAGFLFRPSPR